MCLLYQIIEGMRRTSALRSHVTYLVLEVMRQNKCATYVIYLIYFFREAMRQNKRARHITCLVLETMRQINSATLVIYISL